MATQSPSLLVKLAKDILAQAEGLQRELDNANETCPGLTPDGPLMYPEGTANPGVYAAQQQLATSARQMLQLSIGPTDYIRGIVGPDRTALPALDVIQYFEIHKIVPQEGSISIQSLAEQLDVNAGLLERILRTAFLHGIFQEDTPGTIAHNANSRAIDVLESWTWLMTRPDLCNAFAVWPQTLQNYGKGMRQTPHLVARNSDVPFFKYYSQEGMMDQFTDAMRSHASVTGRDALHVVHTFDWSSLGEGPAVDLGGGSGYIAVNVARAHPSLKVVVQDLPDNERKARNTIPPELKDRVTFQVQDFFQPQADQSLQPKAFFMKAIMHDWSDENCLRILRHLMPYVEKGAKIIIHDRVLPAPGQKPREADYYRCFTDMLMFTVLDALERNRAQWEDLIKKLDPRLKMEILESYGSESSLIVASL